MNQQIPTDGILAMKKQDHIAQKKRKLTDEVINKEQVGMKGLNYVNKDNMKENRTDLQRRANNGESTKGNLHTRDENSRKCYQIKIYMV